MQMPGSARFSVRGVSPTRMVKLFLSSRHGPNRHVAAAAAAGSGSSTDAAMAGPSAAADLVSWVESRGGSAAGVAVAAAADGYGLQAARDAAPGATLVALPQPCHLTYDDSSDPRLLALVQQVPAELWGAKLALQVLAHRLLGEASPFAPYIANLPRGVPGLPMFFSGDTLAALQYPPVTQQVKMRCRWLLAFSRDTLAPLRGGPQDPFEGAEVDANALGWALAVVTSRAFRTRGPTQPASMLPLIDMANHSFTPNAKIAPGPAGSMLMVATRQLRAGEPVLISYGALPNDFLLLDYGFVVPGNPQDTVQLRFDRGLIEAAKAVAGVGSPSGGADDGDAELPPLPAWQQRALVSLQLAGPGANTEVTIRRQSAEGTEAGPAASGPVHPRLLAGVRVLCAPSEGALGGRAATAEQLGAWDAPLAVPAAELAALHTLCGLCAIALGQFQGDLASDQALLAGLAAAGSTAGQQQQQPLSGDERLAVQFRMDKKQLLVHALAALKQRIEQLVPSSSGSDRNGGRAGQGKQPASGSKGKGKVAAAKNGGRGFGGVK